jgi:fibro-slime domain-containing protein
LIVIFSGVAFSVNCVSDTGHEVLGASAAFSPKPGDRATLVPVRITGLVLFVAAACGTRSDSRIPMSGDGDANNGGSDSLPADATSCGALTAILRDFTVDHPDFEQAIADDRGLVSAELGADGKPVYAPSGATATVSGQASFDQWYRDTAGINMHFEQPMPLTENPAGTFTFEDLDFFPLDGLGFPGPRSTVTTSTSTEVHRFVIAAASSASGDDDVWVFVNKKLGLDLGGVHGVQAATIDFDANAGALGIAIGGTYQLDVLRRASRDESNFRMTHDRLLHHRVASRPRAAAGRRGARTHR